MLAILHLLVMFVADVFKSRRRLEAENLFLRHQLNIALRQGPPRLRLHCSDRVLSVWMTQIWPSLLDISQVDRELRDLIQRMSRENALWGAPRVHGELLMLGFEVAQSTVSKYMARGRRPPSQSWKTFLQNHAEAIAAVDMCVVATLPLISCLRFWFWATAGGSCCGSR